MSIFLRAKHWQLFLLTVGIPFIFQIMLFARMVTSIISGQGNINELGYIKFYPLIIILIAGVIFAWFWAIVTELQFKIPENLRLNLKLFKVFFFCGVGYLLIFACFMSVMFGMFFSNAFTPENYFPGIFFLIFPVHLFAMFCIFYCMYVVAKTIKTAELQRPVSFGDFAGEFFMIWFHFIGVWMLQPRLNKMIKPGYEPPKFPW